jgi:hypothetical protein
LSRRAIGAILAAIAAFSTGCRTPLQLSDAHVTSQPLAPSFDLALLACQPVAILGVIAPGAIQGLGPTVSQALSTALSQAAPPIQTIPIVTALNRLVDQQLTGEYTELIASYSRGGIPDRVRLERIGAALGSRYVLQPGLAEFSQSLFDQFEFAGVKIIRTRVSTLHLWLQLWDAQTGHLLAESTGEVTVAAPILSSEATVSLDDIARKLWSRMIKQNVLARADDGWRCP